MKFFPFVTAASSDSNSTSEAKEQQPHGGPKLPKLILSMRDKTVKQKFSKHLETTAAENHSDSDSENGELVNANNSESKLKKMFIPKSPKRTFDTENKPSSSSVTFLNTESGGRSSVTNVTAMTSSNTTSVSSSHNTSRVNHVISNCNMSNTSERSSTTSDHHSSSSSKEQGATGTKKHNSLVNDWTKSLNHSENRSTHNTRLDKGAFGLHENNYEEMDEDLEELDEPQRNKPFSGLNKGACY